MALASNRYEVLEETPAVSRFEVLEEPDSTQRYEPINLSSESFDISKLPKKYPESGAFQPSQFSSGMPQMTADNPDVALTKNLAENVPQDINKATSYVANVARSIPADVAETVKGNEPYYELHNLAAAALGEPLPIDEQLKEASKDSKKWATVGKISQGIAGTAPMAVIGSLPLAAQRLALAGFTAQMISHTPEIASQLGDELGKPVEQQDPDKVSSLVSDAIQNVGFSILGGSHLMRPLVEKMGAVPSTPESIKSTPQDVRGSNLKMPEGAQPTPNLEPVPLDPQTGNPLSATDSLINRLGKTDNITIPETSRYEVIETPVKEFNLDEQPAPKKYKNTGVGSPADEYGAIYGATLTPEQMAKFKEQEGHTFPIESPAGTTTTLKVKPNMLWMETSRPESPGSISHDVGVAYLKIRSDGTTVLDASKHGRPIDKLAAEKLIDFLQKTRGEKNVNKNPIAQIEPPAPQPLNPGGSQADLPPDLQAKSKANNSREAFEALAREKGTTLPVQEKSPLPVSPEKTTPEPAPELVGMGGATPSEFEVGKGSPTAMKYRLIDQERQQRGLEPLVKGESISDQATMDKAMAEIDKNPELPDLLISELNSKPRAIEDWERTALLLRKIDLRNEYEKSAREAAQAYEDSQTFPERKADMERANLQTQIWSDKLTELEKASRVSGSAQGRGLRALRIMANEDYSLASLEMQKRAAKGGEPLTDSERAGLVKIADEYKAKNDALEKHIAERDSKISGMELKAALDKIEREAKQSINPYIISVAEKIVAGLDKRAEAARLRIKERGFRFSSGVDPTVLRDVAEIGASHIGHIGLDFAKWSVKMIEDFGDGVKPYLEQLFKSSQSIIDDLKADPKAKRAVKKEGVTEKISATTAGIKERVKEGSTKDVSGLVQQLARHLVESGIKDREELISAVHAVLKESLPDITRREAMDAISGYGDFRPLSKDEISIALRGMKGEMQQIAKLEDMASGVPPRKTGMERRTPTDAERELIKAVNEAKIKFQVPITDPTTQLKSALDTRKTMLRNQIVDYETRLKNRDFSKPPKRELVTDETATKLQYERDKVKRKFHEEMMKDRLARRSLPQKIMSGFGEVLNTFRAIMTSFDLSAVLRQGGFIAFGHPVRAAKSFPAMFKALLSDKGRYKVEQEILARKNYPLYERSKLYLSEHGQKLSQMEEAYMSRWAEKIPGVAASQRAYTTFLNKLRADSFDAMAKTLVKTGEVTREEAATISNFINVATGRGNLGMKENALVGLNTVFFAPRYVASRFQLLAGQPLYKGTARTRKLVAGEYARFLIGAATVYGLAQMADAEVESDPRSADFGKLRFGNTRVDPLAGLLQNTVLVSRLASGETKNLSGKIVPIRGDKVPYGSSNAADLLARFARTKLAPSPGMVVDLLTGKDVVGNPVTAKSIAANQLIPMSMRDIYEAMKEQGIPEGAALGILSIFGMGLQTYEPKKPKKKQP